MAAPLNVLPRLPISEDPDSYGRPDPVGVAGDAPYQAPAEYLQDLLGILQARLAAEIHERWELGLITEQGDAASSLFLDRARVEKMLQPMAPPPTEAHEQALAAALKRARQVEHRLGVTRLRGLTVPLADAFDAWDLDEADRLLLACVLGAELSPVLARLLSYLGGDVNRPGLSVEAAAAVVHGRAGVLAITRQLAQGMPLRRLALVRVGDSMAELPLLRSMLLPAPRLLALARGEWEVDDTLLGVEQFAERPGSLAMHCVDEDLRRAMHSLCRRSQAHEPVGVLAVRHDLGATMVLGSLAAAEGRRSLVAYTKHLFADEERTRALGREALLFRALIVLVDDGFDSARERPAALAQLLDRMARVGLPLVLVIERSDPQLPRPETPLIQLELPLPDAGVRQRLWKEALGEESHHLDLETVASAYSVGAETIERSAAAARMMAHERSDARLHLDDLTVAMRTQVASDLSAVATRLRVSQTWEDLVVPDDVGDLICELVDRVRQRRRVFVDWGFARKVGKGLGSVALFSGRPGTGKSMVAGLIARELGLDAYQIDISRVMSKWIGETEKSLSLAFDAAESGQALLIFDEADALFARRVVDAKSSTDRYANVETNYILNRLEWFTGVAVLTTNLEGNLDPALRRRTSLHIQFPFPDERQRELLWRALVPREAPTGDGIDYILLAEQYKLSGGQIRNVALRAAFLAASAGEPLTMRWVRTALERQYAGYGKIITSGELD